MKSSLSRASSPHIPPSTTRMQLPLLLLLHLADALALQVAETLLQSNSLREIVLNALVEIRSRSRKLRRLLQQLHDLVRSISLECSRKQTPQQLVVVFQLLPTFLRLRQVLQGANRVEFSTSRFSSLSRRLRHIRPLWIGSPRGDHLSDTPAHPSSSQLAPKSLVDACSPVKTSAASATSLDEQLRFPWRFLTLQHLAQIRLDRKRAQSLPEPLPGVIF